MLADESPTPPAATPDPALAPASGAANPAPIRLLIVEDNRDSCRSLERLFQLFGFAVTTVGDARSALEALGHEPPPQAVLTDLLLPDTDGRVVLQAAAALRPRPYLALITGWNPAEDDPLVRSLGLDGLFLKPLNVREIATLIQRWLEGCDVASS